ncbi:MAG: hypothetical protein GF329_14100 [Candidatus Lokiarchaeota archaeon]|nr:hypothetical protein [Candidatus Lokiarchaeota archaeon]
MKKLKIQYICSFILIIIGIIIAIIFSNSFLSLLGYMLVAGGIILSIIYLEQKWLKQKYLKWGLIATISFAVIYGILEYVFFDATWNNWFKISDWFPNKYFYWAFMTILNFSIVILASRGSLALSLSSIPLFAVNEDLWYWITKSIHELNWVFPVPNWFDEKFPFLHGLGGAISIPPFCPKFYFVGWILVSILLLLMFKKLKGQKFLICLVVFISCSLFSTFLVII